MTTLYLFFLLYSIISRDNLEKAIIDRETSVTQDRHSQLSLPRDFVIGVLSQYVQQEREAGNQDIIICKNEVMYEAFYLAAKQNDFLDSFLGIDDNSHQCVGVYNAFRALGFCHILIPIEEGSDSYRIINCLKASFGQDSFAKLTPELKTMAINIAQQIRRPPK